MIRWSSRCLAEAYRSLQRSRERTQAELAMGVTILNQFAP